MIDLHNHILPGIDDGSQTLEDALALGRLAVSEGITHILCTPHHMNQSWINPRPEVEAHVRRLQKHLDEENIPLTLFPGQEIRIFGDLLQEIERGNICFIDEQEQYLLIEFPTPSVPEYTERLFYELQSAGKTPIVVHPERNLAIQKDPNILYNLVNKGALSQLTAASYVGVLGKEVQDLSRQLIEANLVHFIASDAHNVNKRPFYMKKARDLLIQEYGEGLWKQYDQMTRDLVNGDPIQTPIPQEIKTKKRKRFFGLF